MVSGLRSAPGASAHRPRRRDGPAGSASDLSRAPRWRVFEGVTHPTCFATSEVPPTIGLAEFIMQTIRVTPRDVLVVKMDIEGAEYETIEALIAARAHELLHATLSLGDVVAWHVPGRFGS